MGHSTIGYEHYTPVSYQQFQPSRTFRRLRTLAGILTWPIILPLALLSRCSDFVFITCSELLSLLPYLVGVICRGEFYRFALRSCGQNVVIECGTVFTCRAISIGNHVLIGRYCVIHHCDIGDYVLIGERCTFLSGSKHHHFDRLDIPMALQGGQKKRIRITGDCWIGTGAVVMENIERGAVVGAGSIVNKPVPEYTIVAGNPARPIRQRGTQSR